MNIINYLKNFIPLVASILTLFFSLPQAGGERLSREIAEQAERIAALEQAYAEGEIAPVDQSNFFNGDLQSELDAGLKFNELRYTATHNSYQTESVDELKQLYGQAVRAHLRLCCGKHGRFYKPHADRTAQQRNLQPRA